ncbi:uncharacterized protein BCR38DRAFT_461046 [Pseudomassariella vexata]|uniref:Ketosynthase family 3 (KS3) domain-containing protein n=1 Tax=Pseudomassariella vexata TaxID=1141098 RepID=A0A1Y2DET0_9PEZI|nr:uncharacterized protein BCR38DRAFT_461046 [Pseudomassariella vexata]ORY57749.1 hypothetical protein BCR38DRAFT_461046 [Pseudomassariella vexata]
MEPQQRVLLEVAYASLDDAGYLATHHREDGDNVGCFIGGIFKAIQAGEYRMALTGGVNIMTGMNNFFDLAKAGFLSPTGQRKPFDKLSHAVADGDAILGVILGSPTNQGGFSASLTVPQSVAQQNLNRKVL